MVRKKRLRPLFSFAGDGRCNYNRNRKMGSSFRWNDGDVVCRRQSARTLRAWIPAFAGMTIFWSYDLPGRAMLLSMMLLL
ncbi:hypothetical protein [Lysobacter auxotrophicus]|uniref:hypothetical protein n=1 Tax=Lysobacter auxotrophicus TaxID=2992573 RepID=UPI0024937FE2|nr:hypothetical protein [Lysobacter auxotrophicus]